MKTGTHSNPLVAFNPVPAFINRNFDPRQSVINLNYQPFEVPAILVPLFPDFPPYDPNLTVPNPGYGPNLTVPNPDFDPEVLMENPDYDPNLFTDMRNPDYDTNLFNIVDPVVWTSADDHRSNLAGPALAGAELAARNPEMVIRFLHRAKSGANISAIGEQIDAAIAAAGGRIDVLMISS
jgi:hypothetical protein